MAVVSRRRSLSGQTLRDECKNNGEIHEEKDEDMWE